MNMKTFKVEYISDKPSIFFKKGKIYDAFLPLDNQSGKVFAFQISGMNEGGAYALPASRFKTIDD